MGMVARGLESHDGLGADTVRGLSTSSCHSIVCRTVERCSLTCLDGCAWFVRRRVVSLRERVVACADLRPVWCLANILPI